MNLNVKKTTMKAVDFEDWDNTRRKFLKNKKIIKKVRDISYNEYDTYYSEND